MASVTNEIKINIKDFDKVKEALERLIEAENAIRGLCEGTDSDLVWDYYSEHLKPPKRLSPKRKG